MKKSLIIVSISFALAKSLCAYEWTEKDNAELDDFQRNIWSSLRELDPETRELRLSVAMRIAFRKWATHRWDIPDGELAMHIVRRVETRHTQRDYRTGGMIEWVCELNETNSLPVLLNHAETSTLGGGFVGGCLYTYLYKQGTQGVDYAYAMAQEKRFDAPVRMKAYQAYCDLVDRSVENKEEYLKLMRSVIEIDSSGVLFDDYIRRNDPSWRMSTEREAILRRHLDAATTKREQVILNDKLGEIAWRREGKTEPYPSALRTTVTLTNVTRRATRGNTNNVSVESE